MQKAAGGWGRTCTRRNNYKHAKGEHCFPLNSGFLHPHAHSFSCLVNSSVYSNLKEAFKAFSMLASPSPLLCRNLVASPLKSSTRSQQQPPSKLQQSLSFILAYSPSPPHAVLSAAPNSSICPAGPWQEATAVFLQPNFDWPTSGSHSRVLYFFPFLACTELHSSKGTYAAMEIVLEVTQALLLFVPQLTPTERTERTRRGGTCCSVAFGQTPGQLDSGVENSAET